jgi:hypothetical protein
MISVQDTYSTTETTNKSTVKEKYKEVPLLNSELSYLSRMKLPERLESFLLSFKGIAKLP